MGHDDADGDTPVESLDKLERALIDVVRRTLGRQPHFTLPSGDRLDKAAYVLMSRLEEAGDIRLSDLASILELDLSTVSRQVRQLEGLDLVKRRPDPADGRAARVDLTGSGREALAGERHKRQLLLGSVLLAWPARDRERLTSLLRRLADGLGAPCLKATSATPTPQTTRNSGEAVPA